MCLERSWALHLDTVAEQSSCGDAGSHPVEDNWEVDEAHPLDEEKSEVSLLQRDTSLVRGLKRDAVSDSPGLQTYILHIGKTGSTTIAHALSGYADPSKIITGVGGQKTVSGHEGWKYFMESRINGSSSAPPYKDIVYFVRAPVHRYVSGWISNYRRICDPDFDKNCIRWEDVELRRTDEWAAKTLADFDAYEIDIDFDPVKVFPTPDDLGCALSSDNATLADMAATAMFSLGHVRRSITYYLGGLDGAKRTADQVLFVGSTEHLQDDYEHMVHVLAARGSFVNEPPLELPHDHSNDDMNPDLKMLGRCAVLNLQKYYAEDYQIIQFLAERNLVSKSYYDEVVALDEAPADGQRLSY